VRFVFAHSSQLRAAQEYVEGERCRTFQVMDLDDGELMMQIGRNLTDPIDGSLVETDPFRSHPTLG